MATKYIDDTLNGSGLYPTKMPGYEDAADIQKALKIYHYGEEIVPLQNEIDVLDGIRSKSVVGAIKYLENADAELQDQIDLEVSSRANADLNLQNQVDNLLIELNITNVVTYKTSSFTLLLADAGKNIIGNSSSRITVTIPTNLSVQIPVGYIYTFFQIGVGKMQFVAQNGVTLNSKDSQTFIDGRYGKANLMKVDTNTWVLYGDI
jgi:hypothetical protein